MKRLTSISSFVPALALLLCSAFLILTAPPAEAQFRSGFDAFLDDNQIAVGPGSIRGVLLAITGAILALLGVIAFLAIIIGAIMFVTSVGNEEKAKRAKMTIIYAIAGLLIVGISAMLINAVLFIL